MDTTQDKAFYVKDCSLTTIGLGLKAQTLLELRDKIISIPQNSLYTHFWGGRLRTSFEFSEYHNDFSVWAHRALHDDVLAERLDIINPIDYEDLEGLRTDLIDHIEDRLEEKEVIPLSTRDKQFHFAGSKIIVFNTDIIIKNPEDLPFILPKLTQSSLFYHFIDASRRVSSKVNDFSMWLEGFSPKYNKLICKLNKIDPYFISLSDLRQNLSTIITTYFAHD